MSQEKIHNLLLSRLTTFPTHRAYANHLECDEAELSRIVNGKQLISHRILVDLLTHVLTNPPQTFTTYVDEYGSTVITDGNPIDVEDDVADLIFARPDCVFHYCPNPKQCQASDRCFSPLEEKSNDPQIPT
jgi:hypothetical protein